MPSSRPGPAWPACPRSKPRGFSAFQTPRESKLTPREGAAEASVLEIRSPKPQFYLPNLNKPYPRTSGRTSAPILPLHEPFLHARSSPKRPYRTPESLVAYQGQEPPGALFTFQNPNRLSRGAPIPSLLLGCPHPCCQADLLRLADPRPSLLPRGFSQKYGLGTFELRPSWWVASGDEPFEESWALLTAPLRDSALSLPSSHPPRNTGCRND